MKLPRLPFKVPAAVARIFWKGVRKFNKNKPELCLAGGLITGTAAVIFVGVETWKNKDKLVGDAREIKKLREYDPQKAIEENPDAVLVTEEERDAKLRSAYFRMGKDICIAYWKPLLCGGTSAFLIFTGHHTLRRQLGEMTAAYATLLNAYNQYRKNVIADVGVEKNQEYEYGVKYEDHVDADTGEVTKHAVVDHKRIASPYAVYLNEGDWDDDSGKWLWHNPLWTSNRGDLERRVRLAQYECNNILDRRGYLFLNEARFQLRLPPVKEGWIVGWVKHDGDSFVDFGVFPDYQNGKFQLPVNKLFLDYTSGQRCPLIDFNVDGDITYIFDDIYEYDNMSNVVYDKRGKLGGLNRSKEALHRWFKHNELMEEY